MGRRVPYLLALGLLVPAAHAEVAVRVSGDRVDVSVTAAPLAEVLEDLGRQTGMKIVYDVAPPRQPVSVGFAGRSPSQAVQALLEGQGLNYALIADPSGTRVQTLLLAGPIGRESATGRPRAVRSPPRPAPEIMDPALEEALADEPFEPSLPQDDPLGGRPATDLARQPAGTPITPQPNGPAVPPMAGPLPYPGGQPPIYSASPFTPQPNFAAPVPATPDRAEARPAPPE